MDETELTRKAIQEIMREMDAQKEADKLPQIRERKLNPLGRPNKDFLDRTLNSVMTHNKRQWERNQRKCQSKLKDMDEAKADEQPKRQVRERYRTQRKMKRKRRHSVSTASSSSRRDSSSSKERTTKHKKSKKKKKRNKKKARSKSPPSTSSSSLSLDTSSSSSSNSSNKSIRKRRKPKTEDIEADYGRGSFYPQHVDHLDPTSLGYYVDPNMALAVMAYSHMNQLLQQQQQSMQDLVKEELEHNESDDNKVDIPSDLSLTYHSESELNISLNSSSAEEDENGVLTFKLTSDEEQMTNKAFTTMLRKRKLPTKPRGKLAKSKPSNENENTLSDTSSEPNKTSKKHPAVDEEITIISSSSSSDSEQDVAKLTESITTIISSSSSSSETDNDETVRKQEEITILSSCSSSSDTEENDVGKKNQEENESTMSNHDKDLKTDSESTEAMLKRSDLTNLDNKKAENVNETIASTTSQKQVEEAINLLSCSSSTNMKIDELEMVVNDSIHSNFALTKERQNLATAKLCETQTHQETSSSSYYDIIEENADTTISDPTNDASSSVEKQVETTTFLSKDEQNTKEKTSILSHSLSTSFEIKEPHNIASKSDSKEIEKHSNEYENEICLSATKQEEISDLNQSTQSIIEGKVNEVFQKPPEQIESVEDEIITTETNENAIHLEAKEKDPKTDGNVNAIINLKKEREDVKTKDNNVNEPVNVILLDVTDD